VIVIPVSMKKGRPGMKVEVLTVPGNEPHLVRLLLRETTTLGVRAYPVDRYRADRSIVEVVTAFGSVPVKVKEIGGARVGVAPEYEACRALAAQLGVPLIEIYQSALTAGRALLDAGS
jgi:uncharacterized protein (DUF111 family)